MSSSFVVVVVWIPPQRFSTNDRLKQSPAHLCRKAPFAHLNLRRTVRYSTVGCAPTRRSVAGGPGKGCPVRCGSQRIGLGGPRGALDVPRDVARELGHWCYLVGRGGDYVETRKPASDVSRRVSKRAATIRTTANNRVKNLSWPSSNALSAYGSTRWTSLSA